MDYKKIEDTLNIFLLEKIKENINLKKNIDESRKSIQEESLKKWEITILSIKEEISEIKNKLNLDSK